MNKKYTFFEINREISKHGLGLQAKLWAYLAASVLIRLVPIGAAAIISHLVNQKLAPNSSTLEGLLETLPFSLLAVFSTIKLGEWALNLASRIYFINIMIEAGAGFCSRAFNALARMPLAKVAQRSPAEWASLLNKRQDIILNFSLFYSHLVPLLIELFLIVVFVALSGQYAISFIFVASLALNLLIRFKASKPLEKLLKSYFKAEASMGLRSYEFVSKIYLAKLFHSEDFVSKLRSQREAEELGIYKKHKKIIQVVDSLQDSINVVALVAIFAMGLASCESRQLTMGAFVGLFTLVAAGFSQFKNMAYAFDGIFSFVAIAQAHMGVLEFERENGDSSKPKEPLPAGLGQGEGLLPLCVDGVGFSYGQSQVLMGISFKMEPSEKVFLIGGSGSGKTTLIKLLLGLAPPDSGSVRYGAGASESIFSYVPQSLDLFDDSVGNNLLVGNPRAGQEDCKRCLSSMNMLEKVEAMGGLDAEVGQFSGGEKQRIAIARALLSNKPIMLLDEATSSLDASNERIIIDEIISAKVGAIISIHRMRSIPRDGRCIVLDKGMIVQDGALKELVEQEGLLKKLWEASERS